MSGKGSHILASDGRDYIDFTCGLGAISLGHSDDDVNEAVRRQLQKGTIFGLPTQIEFDMADALADWMPWKDYGVKYGKHGSDVTQAAIRAARFITGRDRIISSGYHGWGDAFCPNRGGIPQDISDLTIEALADWSRSFCMDDGCVCWSDIACVIVEPDIVAEDLIAMREWCDKAGALLIFDEVLTGGRCPGFTYAKWKGVTPDLICLAKAISNGVPLSVIAGKAEYMKVFGGDIGFSFTYGGETTSLAAGIATLAKYQREPVIEHLWRVGDELRQWWDIEEARLGLDIPLTGLSPRTVVKYPSLAYKTLISQEFIRRGILFTVGFTACYAHTAEDVYRTRNAISEVLDIVANCDGQPERLVEGPLIQLGFRKMTTL